MAACSIYGLPCFQAVGKVGCRVPDPHFINEGNAGDPIPALDPPMALLVILAAAEVPHKIAEIHPGNLVGEEEPEVFSKCRSEDGGCFPSGSVTSIGSPLPPHSL